MNEKEPLLGPLELRVMNIVWDRGDVSVAEVLQRLGSEPPLHHNTVMTTLTRLAKKGVLEKYARDGRTHGYRPRLARKDLCDRYLRLVVNELFKGSAAATLVAFLGMDKKSLGLSPRKLARLRRLADELQGDASDSDRGSDTDGGIGGSHA